MTEGEPKTEVARAGMPPWAKKAIAVAVTLLVLVVAYFVLAAFLPRWWSMRVAGLADQGFARGIAWGLLFGVLCTAVPLALLSRIWQVRRWKYRRVPQIVMAVGALVVALPNLLTLTVVWGSGNAAHAGERVMDTEAPGFRGASLVGAIVGLLLFLLVEFAIFRYRKRGNEVRTMRDDLDHRTRAEEREKELLDEDRDAGV